MAKLLFLSDPIYQFFYSACVYIFPRDIKFKFKNLQGKIKNVRNIKIALCNK